MKAMMLIAHGSRNAGANEEVKMLVNNLQSRLAEDFDLFQTAFLELAEPSISASIDDLVKAGAKEIIVLPYFLNKGRHVSEDVPKELTAKQQQYTDILIHSLPYFGISAEVQDLLVAMLQRPGEER